MFIGGLCKVKISSPRPTRRKEKIQTETAEVLGPLWKGPVCTLQKSGWSSWLAGQGDSLPHTCKFYESVCEEAGSHIAQTSLKLFVVNDDLKLTSDSCQSKGWIAGVGCRVAEFTAAQSMALILCSTTSLVR